MPEPKPAAVLHAADWSAPTAARMTLARRLRDEGVASEAVLTALTRIPRERFVDEALWSRAYEDTALPIGHGQTISQPFIVARMIESVLPRKGRFKRVLEVGTGCGYQAAVLSQLADEVYSIERIKPLYERARANLRPLRLANVRLAYGDGYAGLPAAAPFDAIVVAAAAPQIPEALKQQLTRGGKIIIPVGRDDQQLLLLERRVAGFIEKRLELVRFVPMLHGLVPA
ncbi:MAG: protein-L-isoaspartate(D-aspartate) O-methyltransferase [Burkholderiales bacterium]